MTRVAVIGMGTWGRQLIRVFNDLADVVLCCNRSDSRAREWVQLEYPSIRVGSSAREAIEDPMVEAVVIATPIASHASLARDALEHGKHVFVEKPLAMTTLDAQRLVEAAEKAGRVLFVGHVFLFDAGLGVLHGLVQDDTIEAIDLSWLKYGTFREPLVWNLLSHEVAIAMWLTGRAPKLVVREQASGPSPLDRLRLGLDFGPLGPEGSIEIDRLHDRQTKSVRVRMLSGTEYRWRDGDLDRIDVAGRAERLVSHQEEALVREVRGFLDGLWTGRVVGSDGAFGAAVVAAIEPLANALEASSMLVADRDRPR